MHLFMHEGSHFNMAPNKKWNDRLTNAFVGTLVGIHMKPYRPNHLNHHRHLGTPKDTEISYFDPLNLSFFLQSLLGLRVFKVLLNWGKVHKIESIKTNKYDKWLAYRALVTALLLHGIICGIAIWQGAYIFAVAWAFGTCGVYPFFAALRTVLEHRSEDADKTIDYHFVDHGKVNRMFGIGPVASTLGHAGFNRHLLHHMEPQISYTRLRELETFLYDTSWGREQLPSFRTTYARTFARLFNK